MYYDIENLDEYFKDLYRQYKEEVKGNLSNQLKAIWQDIKNLDTRNILLPTQIFITPVTCMKILRRQVPLVTSLVA